MFVTRSNAQGLVINKHSLSRIILLFFTFTSLKGFQRRQENPLISKPPIAPSWFHCVPLFLFTVKMAPNIAMYCINNISKNIRTWGLFSLSFLHYLFVLNIICGVGLRFARPYDTFS